MLQKPLPFFALGRELNEMQNRMRTLFGPDFMLEPLTEPVGWVPKVEIMELEKELVVTAELPGLNREDIEITFEDELLTIRGEKKLEKKEEKNGGAKYLLWERTYGEFLRTFTLPFAVDPAKIIAEMKDGVLTIHLPKTEVQKVKGRKIEIAAK
jgi:HSP20 family protein